MGISLPFISGRHFSLKNEAGHVRVEGLNSTNGLFLNGRRVSVAGIFDRREQAVWEPMRWLPHVQGESGGPRPGHYLPVLYGWRSSSRR